jgi:hypothetical protein
MIERKVSQTIRPSSGSMNLDAGKVSLVRKRLSWRVLALPVS